ncbi:hypothetical protein HDU77_003031 [Chytriomyces hyalinus]|nr:hypothetical protein HDU77_003031 [Chytriomyces hyalinus]
MKHLKHRKSRKAREKETSILTATMLPAFVNRLEQVSLEQLRKEELHKNAQVVRLEVPEPTDHEIVRAFLQSRQAEAAPAVAKTRPADKKKEADDSVIWKIAPKEHYSISEQRLMVACNVMESRFLKKPLDAVLDSA